MNNNMCSCGKKRFGLNNTNWSRHIISCKKKKICTGNNTIENFFKIPTTTSSALTKGDYYLLLF